MCVCVCVCARARARLKLSWKCSSWDNFRHDVGLVSSVDVVLNTKQHARFNCHFCLLRFRTMRFFSNHIKNALSVWVSGKQDLFFTKTFVIRLQEILSGSSYTFSSKIEENCPLFLNNYSIAIMNDLTMTFTSRLKMNAKCANQQWNWIRVVNYFGTPPPDWMLGLYVLSLVRGSELRGSDVYLHTVKQMIWKYFFKFSQGT